MERRKRERTAIEYDLILFIKKENSPYRPYHVIDLNENGIRIFSGKEVFNPNEPLTVTFESNRKRYEVPAQIAWTKHIGTVGNEKTPNLLIGIHFAKQIPSSIVSEYLFLSFTEPSIKKAA